MDTEIGSKSDAARRLGCRQDWVRRGVELESSSTCDRELQRRESGRRTGVAPLGRRRRARPMPLHGVVGTPKEGVDDLDKMLS